MANPTHTTEQGYYYNYVHDAAHLYWAARWLELNKPTNEKERVLEELMIRRLRNGAEGLMKFGISNLIKSPAQEIGLLETLTGKIHGVK